MENASTNVLIFVKSQSLKSTIHQITIASILVLISVLVVSAQTPKIEITQPKDPSTPSPYQDTARIAFKITGPASNKRIRVRLDGGQDVVTSGEIVLSPAAEHVITVNLFKGANHITIIGFVGDEPNSTLGPKIEAVCNTPWCKDYFSIKPDGVASEYTGAPPTAASSPSPQNRKPADEPNQTGAIHIQNPDPGVTNHYQDSVVPFKITIDPNSKDASKNVKSVYLRVLNSQKPVAQKPDQIEKAVNFTGTNAFEWNPNVTLAAGTNEVTIFEPGNYDTQRATISVVCDKCTEVPAAPVADTIDKSQKGAVNINSPAHPTSTYNNAKFHPPDIGVIVSRKDGGENVKRLHLEVLNGNTRVPQEITIDKDVTFPADAKKNAEVAFASVRILKGVNQITVSDAGDNKDSQRDYIEIRCDQGCEAKPEAPAITILSPSDGEEFDISFADVYLSVARSSHLNKINYNVTHNGETVVAPKGSEIADVQYPEGEAPGTATVHVKFVEGENQINFFDAKDTSSTKPLGTLKLKCAGTKCAHDFLFVTIPSSSQNTRVVTGLEQAGASSSKSETKPFIDFFFTTPIAFGRSHHDLVQTPLFNSDGTAVLEQGRPKFVWVRRSVLPSGDELLSTSEFDADGNAKPTVVWIRKSFLPPDKIAAPRFGFWGEVRLSSTPEQLTTTGVLPSSLVNLVASNGATGNLVQSFDFLAGVEGRLFTANGSFLSLIPGISQKTRFYLAAAVGDISPLDATTENPKFFSIPGKTSSQRALFEQRYGKPPDTATYLALVPLERDRFLRQWFAGLRLKTFYCDGPADGHGECRTFRNSFPAIVDFMIGQSESVTGGSYKRTEVDPVTKVSKVRQAFVFRIDAFYPLPIREASFIYLYGTAVMKVGGNQKIENFLVLDPATSAPNINDPTVYVPPVDFLRGLQSNRDYYKIGVGINLTDFFNRNKTPPH